MKMKKKKKFLSPLISNRAKTGEEDWKRLTARVTTAWTSMVKWMHISQKMVLSWVK